MYSTPGPSLPSSPHIAHIVIGDHSLQPPSIAFLEDTASIRYDSPSIPDGSSVHCVSTIVSLVSGTIPVAVFSNLFVLRKFCN